MSNQSQQQTLVRNALGVIADKYGPPSTCADPEAIIAQLCAYALYFEQVVGSERCAATLKGLCRSVGGEGMVAHHDYQETADRGIHGHR